MQAVLFDFFGVVARPRVISTNIARLLKASVDEVKPFYERYEAGALTCEKFWGAFGITDYQEMEKKLAMMYDIDPSFKPVHAELTKNYVTTVVSNSDSHLLRSLLKRFELEDAFEAVIISQEVGCQKPDPTIYRKALAAIGVNARECVFVDDRLENLKTAHELGMITVFNLVEPETDGYQPDYTINSLQELLDALEDVG